MLCDRCNINQASIHLENNINGTVKKADLCPKCAQLLGLTPNGGLFEQFFAHGALGTGGLSSAAMNHNIFGIPQNMRVTEVGADTCPTCGTHFHEFQKTALFGCPECYKAFQPRLASIFKRVQAGQVHVGRKLAMSESTKETTDNSVTIEASETPVKKIKNTEPTQEVTIESLRQEQNAAVADEDYERAAQIRDQIKALESSPKNAKKMAKDKISLTITDKTENIENEENNKEEKED